MYASGTGAWAATINSASSFSRTVGIEFGRASGPGVQQVFRDTVVWCAASWAASQQLVAALESQGLPPATLAASEGKEEDCSECCDTGAASRLARASVTGLAGASPLEAEPEQIAAVPVSAAFGPIQPEADSKTPSQQSGGGSVPRLVLVLPLIVAAIGAPALHLHEPVETMNGRAWRPASPQGIGVPVCGPTRSRPGPATPVTRPSPPPSFHSKSSRPLQPQVLPSASDWGLPQNLPQQRCTRNSCGCAPLRRGVAPAVPCSRQCAMEATPRPEPSRPAA